MTSRERVSGSATFADAQTFPSKPWPVADVTFVQVRIVQPHERQMRIEFDDRVSLVKKGQAF
jgi:hypothetical protein